ncbi:hypothetical protein UK23_23200 [Lentzea aerocolonigenes]|uniref:Uncharacterized protein n=2 Tax=Lentzea aerocolonigenes TaxID=68170 RepID=A0A0F0GWY4_LENAE|nr:hypothetical protein UK23_23200 [Lentzea aerocolonigenes]
MGVAVLAIVGISVTLIVLASGKDEPEPAAFCPTDRGGAVLESSQLDGRTEPLSASGPRPTILVSDGHNVSYLFGQQQVPEWEYRDKAQLVVCEYTHSLQYNATSCPDDSGKLGRIPVFRTTSTYVVYEAATKKPLGRFDLPGTQYTCPSVVSYEPGHEDEVKIIGHADAREVVAQLRPYVEPR